MTLKRKNRKVIEIEPGKKGIAKEIEEISRKGEIKNQKKNVISVNFVNFAN